MPAQPKRNDFFVILAIGFLVGTLDIVSAFVDYYIATGKGPQGVLKYVASGVFGPSAFTGGTGMIISGLLFHYLAAFLFTFFFYFLFKRIYFLSQHPVLTGVIYGLFIWAIMNLIVVPASKVPPRHLEPAKAVKAALILIFIIGLPLSLLTKKYLDRRLAVVPN